MTTFVAVATFCSTSWTLLTFGMKVVSASVTLIWLVFRPSGYSTSTFFIFCFFSFADCVHCTIRLCSWLGSRELLIAFSCICVASSVRAISFAFVKANSLPRAMHFFLTSSESVPNTYVSRMSSCNSCG